MREDWNNQELCTAWLNEMGTNGDLPRRMFIIPIILSLASNFVKARNDELTSSMKDGVRNYANILSTKDYDPAQMQDSINLSGLNCLDLGCGQGYIQRHLSYLNVRYLGIDASAEFISKAKQTNISNQSQYLKMDLDQLGNPLAMDLVAEMVDGVFENEGPHLIFCHAMIEHLIDPEQFLNALRRLVAYLFPKAIISIIILNLEFFSSLITKQTSSTSSKYINAGSLLVPKTGFPVTVNIFSVECFQEMLCIAGMEILESLQFKKSLYREELWRKFSIEYCIPHGSIIGPFHAFTVRLK